MDYESNINEQKQDQATEDKIAALDYIFNSTPTSTNDEFDLTRNLPFTAANLNEGKNDEQTDEMEKTLEIGSVELEQLKQLKRQLEGSYDNNEMTGGMTNGGKVLTKTKPGAPSYKERSQLSEGGQILESFIACVQLAGITALMGTAWLVNLIIHIR